MRKALKDAGKPGEIVVYPDTPHGFYADYRPSYRKEQGRGRLEAAAGVVQEVRRGVVSGQPALRTTYRLVQQRAALGIAMAVDSTILAVLAVIFLATLIRSAFGFGEALVAVPLLALVIPVEVAAPLAVLVSITVAAIVVVQDWHQVHLGSAWRLVVATAVRHPAGPAAADGGRRARGQGDPGRRHHRLLDLLPAEPQTVRAADDRLAWLFGFAAGVLGGAYGMNGPPLVVYGDPAPLVARALPGDAARLLPAREPARHGRATGWLACWCRR